MNDKEAAFAALMDTIIVPPSVKPTPQPPASKPTLKPKRGHARWEMAVAEFHNCPVGERHATLIKLLRQGRWLEMNGQYDEGETVDIIYGAAIHNGYISGHEDFDAVAASVRAWATEKYVAMEVGVGSSPIIGTSIATSYIATYKYTHIAEQVHLCRLPDMSKRCAYVYLAYARRHNYPWLMLSTRILGAAVGVESMTVSRYLHAHDKAGIVRLEAGQGVNEVGRPVRTNRIHLDLDRYPNRPLPRPSVDLSLYDEAAEVIETTIRSKVAENRAQRRAHVKEHDISTADEPRDILAEFHELMGGMK